MKIAITYKVETAAGHWNTHGIYAYTMQEAQELCESIEALGYKIVDVTREE